jgi:PKD repeat protein
MVRIAVGLALVGLLLVGLVGCGSIEAQFTAAPRAGQPPAAVQFRDLSRGNVSSWEWSFGDGTADSTERNPRHTYGNPGNYTVTLTVRGLGGNDTERKMDYLRFTPPSCKAGFIAERTTVTGVTPLRFIDQSTGNITAWAWDFESDGVVDSTDQNPTHTYRKDGAYSVTLTVVTPDCRHTLTKSNYISVSGCAT